MVCLMTTFQAATTDSWGRSPRLKVEDGGLTAEQKDVRAKVDGRERQDSRCRCFLDSSKLVCYFFVWVRLDTRREQFLSQALNRFRLMVNVQAVTTPFHYPKAVWSTLQQHYSRLYLQRKMQLPKSCCRKYSLWACFDLGRCRARTWNDRGQIS